MSYFDLHVKYGKEIERICEKLNWLKFKYVGVCFKFEEKDFIEDARKIAEKFNLCFFSRIDLEVKDVSQYHHLVSKAKVYFDLVCIKKAPLELLKRVNLKRVSIIDISTVSPKLLWRIKAVGESIVLELNFRELLKEFWRKSGKAEKTIVNLMVFDRFNAPIILSSGAEVESEVLSPTQMIYTFSALLRKREINKKYILTAPQTLIRNIMPLKWRIEGI